MTNSYELGGDTTNTQYIDFAGTTGKYALLMGPDYDTNEMGKQTSYVSYGASAIPDTSYSAWARFRGDTKGIRQPGIPRYQPPARTVAPECVAKHQHIGQNAIAVAK